MVEREYSKSETEFKEIFILKALKGVGKLKDVGLRKMLGIRYDERYQKTNIEIENSQSAKVHSVEADKFYLNAGKKFILNESGTLTWKHRIKLGVIIPIIQSAIKIRQIKKKAKVKAAEIGDNIHLNILSNEEYTLKIVING